MEATNRLIYTQVFYLSVALDWPHSIDPIAEPNNFCPQSNFLSDIIFWGFDDSQEIGVIKTIFFFLQMIGAASRFQSSKQLVNTN